MKIKTTKSILAPIVDAASRVLGSKVYDQSYLGADFSVDKDGHATLFIRKEGAALSLLCDLGEDDANVQGTVHVLDFKTLTELVKLASDEEIAVESDDDRQSLCVTSGTNRSAIPTSDALLPKDDSFPEGDATAEIKSPDDAFLKLLKSVNYSTGDDDLRPVMQNVCVDFGDDGIIVAATDSRRIAVAMLPGDYAIKTGRILVPQYICNIAKYMSADGGAVTFRQNTDKPHVFSIATGPFVLTNGHQPAGKFPDYRKVFPKDNPHFITVERTALISALKTVSNFAGGTNSPAKFSFTKELTGDTLTVIGEDIGFNMKASQNIPCETDLVETVKVGFNCALLQEMLANLPDESITFHIKDPRTPVLLTAADAEGKTVDRGVITTILVA